MHKDTVQVTANLEKLKQLLEKKPDTTHVYMRRDDDQSVDIPIGTAILTIRNNPSWKLEGVATAEPANMLGGRSAASHAPKGPDIDVPAKPSEQVAQAAGAEVAEAHGDKPLTSDGKKAYKVQKKLEFNGKEYARYEVLELSDAEAAQFPAGSIKASAK